jgi:microcystin-dependent protein
MSSPFVAEIRIVPFNFPPKGWAQCDGQLLPISQNTALFSLLGTYYGGNGQTNFALPNLQGRAPLQPGQGPGLSDYALGEPGGAAAVTLVSTEMPGHTHNALAAAAAGQGMPQAAAWGAASGRTPPPLYAGGPPSAPMAPGAFAVTGGDQPHNNLSPYLVLNFVIAMQGVFPPRW